MANGQPTVMGDDNRVLEKDVILTAFLIPHEPELVLPKGV